MKDNIYYFHQTPESLCKDIISNIPFEIGDVVLEPFAGENNFYDNIPEEIQKHRCEIQDDGGCFKNFDYDGFKPTTIITNPPFRLDGKNEFFNILMFLADKKSITKMYILCSSSCLGSLTPIRMNKLNDKNIYINKITTVSIKKWFGRYSLIEFSRTHNPNFDYYLSNYE